ncbi:MAG: hypothetical protein ACJ75J_01865, partial [Cytophagaceae bacterium]
MKKQYTILVILLLAAGSLWAQIEFTPLQSDPHRHSASGIDHSGNFRIAASASVNAVTKVKDTLRIPFFEDFTSLTPPIDSVHFTSGDTVWFTTFGLHGLYNGNQIRIFGAKASPNVFADSVFFNSGFYVKRINPFKVELYSDAALTAPVIGTGSAFIGNDRGSWVRSVYHRSQNPDTLKWMNTGGVYINDRYGINPPSYNVATFDGLDANGKAYSASNVIGATDTLTSLPINIQAFTPADSMVLSFYWQGGGNGEKPDLSDSIMLEMKNSSGIWKYAWGMKGDSTDFRQAIVTLKDPLYFHKGFQFRFISYGKISGSYDIWNLDYIILDTNNTATPTSHRDLTAISSIPVSILNGYTAIPYKEFFKQKLLLSSANYVVRNLSESDPSVIYTKANSEIKDEFTNTVFEPITINTSPTQLFPGNIDTLSFSIDASKIYSLGGPIKLKYLISASTPDNVAFGIDSRTNDSAFCYNMLDNYYAYDDSSAEASANLTAAGQVAVKYTLASSSVKDTMIGVDIYFPDIFTNLSLPGTPMVLTIWSDINTDQVLHKQSIAFSYRNLNQYKRFMLDSLVTVGNTFYVGYGQTVNKKIPVGWDLNTDSHDKTFYNVSNFWSPFPDKGSLMIRPVFGSSVSVPTGLFSARLSDLDCEVFPNPGTGVFHISGDVNHVSITDLTGRMVMEKEFSNAGYNDLDAS